MVIRDEKGLNDSGLLYFGREFYDKIKQYIAALKFSDLSEHKYTFEDGGTVEFRPDGLYFFDEDLEQEVLITPEKILVWKTGDPTFEIVGRGEFKVGNSSFHLPTPPAQGQIALTSDIDNLILDCGTSTTNITTV